MTTLRKTNFHGGCALRGFVAAAFFLSSACACTGAESVPTLDQSLTQAMDKNPGIIATTAKLAMAEAELRNARFEVARQLVACWNGIRDQERALAIAEEQVKSAEAGPDEYRFNAAKVALIDAKAKLERARSELQFLTGQTPAAVSGSVSSDCATTAFRVPLQIPRGPLVEKVRRALNAPTKFEFFNLPLFAVADYLKDYNKIEIQIDSEIISDKTPITSNLSGLSLGAALEAWDDKFHKLKFVVRDYGILVTSPERAKQEGYMPVVEFFRMEPSSTQTTEHTPRKELSRPKQSKSAGLSAKGAEPEKPESPSHQSNH
jgi:hypothetical protein